MAGLQDQQEVMADLAEIIMQVFALESALLRARKLAEQGTGNRDQGSGSAAAQVAASMTGLLADETMALAEQASRRVLAACGEGDMLRTQLSILRRLTKFTPADAVGLSRTVAKHCIQVERYPF
jgi:butyryl-CoA dehydrogenase